MGFPEIKKRLGFGCMRLPMREGEVEYGEFCRMIDIYLENGFNYFDTAHGYLDGKSETAIRDCLVARYPRESFLLANKLSAPYFESEEEIRPFFDAQLAACGVEYFDFYLMHAQNKSVFEKYKRCRAYETAFALRDEGRVRHVGLSFHDKAVVLDEILSTYPEIEFVQIQFNYLDYHDPAVQGRECYEVCRKHGKPVMVMEPVKGGNLVNLPEDAEAVLAALQGGSVASFALRFVAGFQGVVMVLSGMGNMDMMRDNLDTMSEPRPLDEREREAIAGVCRMMEEKRLIACTSCKYCVAGCPAGIKIPSLFSCLNNRELFRDFDAKGRYRMYTKSAGKASDCLRCGACEEICPQQLPIRRLLVTVAGELED